MSNEPITHMIRVPAKLFAMETICGISMNDHIEELSDHKITSDENQLTCPACLAMKGKMLTTGADGEPLITSFKIEDDGMRIELGHRLVGEMAAAFFAMLDDAGAPNFLEAIFGHPAHPEKGEITVRVQRKKGKTPTDLLKEEKSLLDRAMDLIHYLRDQQISGNEQEVMQLISDYDNRRKSDADLRKAADKSMDTLKKQTEE